MTGFGKWCATTFSLISLRSHSDANFVFVMNSADSGDVARGGRAPAQAISSRQGVGRVYKASQLRLTPTDSALKAENIWLAQWS
jgi:hypothetical protein